MLDRRIFIYYLYPNITTLTKEEIVRLDLVLIIKFSRILIALGLTLLVYYY